jgi:hypothetical protein
MFNALLNACNGEAASRKFKYSRAVNTFNTFNTFNTSQLREAILEGQLDPTRVAELSIKSLGDLREPRSAQQR